MSIKEKKRKIAQLFAKELLKTNPGNISSIFLFGSLVKDKVDKESDIDMMIFTKQPKKISEKVKELAFDFLLKKNEVIEPQVYSEKDYQNPPSYFVWQVLEKGEKIF
jgi:predicted nucleotidyltransferase